ncbi:MAG: hypothetical protein JWO10_2009 [Microbacteriaceae bacterium]|nr:hypothetical protein [Microbacteriaceae bacterium]
MTGAPQAASWNPRALPDQSGKTFVVTGGNAGLGYFMCEQLARAGGRVIIAARSPQKMAAAISSITTQVPGADVSAVVLDLSSYASVRRAAAELAAIGRIDVLIENAGRIMPSRVRAETEDGNEATFGTNHLGHFLLTALLLPKLESTPGSRVVVMGSQATKLTPADLDDLQSSKNFSAWKAYGQSKHATQAFGFELDRRLRAAGSSTSALVAHPGSAIDGLSPTRPGIVEPTGRERFIARLQSPINGSKETGAWPAVRAATDPDARGWLYWGPRGALWGHPVVAKAVKLDRSPEFGAALWAESERLVGQKFDV